MAQLNYLINTTTIDTTAGGTTIASGNTQDASWTLAQTLVRASIPAAAFLATSQTWSLHLVVSATTGQYAFRFKLQRRNSGGTMQTESPYYENTAVAVGTIDADLTWASGTWAANDQLALVWEDYRTGGSGNKSGTLSANGSSYITAPTATATYEKTGFSTTGGVSFGADVMVLDEFGYATVGGAALGFDEMILQEAGYATLGSAGFGVSEFVGQGPDTFIKAGAGIIG